MFDLKALLRFRSKAYRDAYMQGRVRAGIANQIRAMRTKAGKSQTEFADLTGKKQSVVSRLENTAYGKMSVQTLLDIASSLDVALLVRFVSYPEFMRRTSDMSEAALQPATIFETLDNGADLSPPRRGVTAWAIQETYAQQGQGGELQRLLEGGKGGSTIDQFGVSNSPPRQDATGLLEHSRMTH